MMQQLPVMRLTEASPSPNFSLPTPTPGLTAPIAEWGLVSVLIVLAAQSAVKWFGKKEEQESRLIESLICGLQTNQTELVDRLTKTQERLVETQERQQSLLVEMKEAILRMETTVHREHQAAFQKQEQAISELRAQIKLLQSRTLTPKQPV
jgi:hypothetical protein